MDMASHYADMNAHHEGEAKALKCNCSEEEKNKDTWPLVLVPAVSLVSVSESSSVVECLMRGLIMYAAYCEPPNGAECPADGVDV